MSALAPKPINAWLVAGGLLSAAASLLHLAIIAGGPSWFRFFGAGERMAWMAERGSPMPVVWSVGIAAVLAIWSAYAFAGAGLIGRLPLMRAALVAVSAVYLVRGLAPLPVFALRGQPITPFWVWSSLIVLIYGVTYAVGTARAWPRL